MTLVAPQKPHHSYRKRTGQHQHRHKNFAKTYWPYLPLLLVVGLGFALNSMWPSHRSVLGYATDMSAQTLLTDTNEQRIAHHESPLTLNDKLNAAAAAKAHDMATKNYWSHNTPSGQTPWSFIIAAGYDYRTAGENLAYGFDTAAATMTGWMNSPEHRANILNVGYTNVGFATINIPNYQNSGPQTLVVAMYASPVATTTAAKNAGTADPAATHQSVLLKGDTVTPANLPAGTQDSEQRIARIQLVANGEAEWSLMAILVVVTLLFGLLLVRHGYAWHKMLNRSERFVLHHPLLDIAAVALITLGVVLSHTAGFIR